LLEKQEKLQFELVKEISSKLEMLKKESLRTRLEEASQKQKHLEE
jgi:hypothetical protein